VAKSRDSEVWDDLHIMQEEYFDPYSSIHVLGKLIESSRLSIWKIVLFSNCVGISLCKARIKIDIWIRDGKGMKDDGDILE